MTTHSGAEAAAARVTLGDLGVTKLRSLCRGLGVARSHRLVAERVFCRLSAPWATWEAGTAPPWPNDITDDGSPFELSVAWGPDQTLDVRMLVEVQALPLSPTSSWSAGLALARACASRADLALFEGVLHLFEPVAGLPRFSLWHAAVVKADGRVSFKAYFNPQVRGPELAPRLTAEAFARVGLGASWRGLTRLVAAADGAAELKYVSVDLEAPPTARVKAYVSVPSLTAGALGRLAAATGAADLTSAVERLMGSERQSGPRPILLCFALRAPRVGDGRAPLRSAETTIHVPIRHYVAHDGEAVRRVGRLLSQADAERLRCAARAMAQRPLGVGRGLVTYASLRSEDAERPPRITVYLAPEVYAIASPRRVFAPKEKSHEDHLR